MGSEATDLLRLSLRCDLLGTGLGELWADNSNSRRTQHTARQRVRGAH